MQPYINPNYFNQYPTIPNYTQQYQNYPTQSYSLISGKMVDNQGEISANDVPMDSSLSVFPKRDMSEIYCKRWNNNGTISTVVYKPYIEPEKVDEKEPDKIDDIISRLERIEKNLKPTINKKKEVSDNE